MPGSHPSSSNWEDNVFINCPFDGTYRPFFEALVFTIHDSGFKPRCSLEGLDSGEVRISKIIRLLKSCRYAVHDLSRTEPDPKTKLPRFNMPLELGLDLGLRHSEHQALSQKKCLVLDRRRYRYQKFISDIAGQDPRSHDLKVPKLITVVRDWLRSESGRSTVPTAPSIVNRYSLFEKDLPRLSRDVPRSKLTFADLSNIISTWLTSTGNLLAPMTKITR